jgi:hypothetical protein
MTAYPGQALTRTTLGQLCASLWDFQSRPVVIQPGIEPGSVVKPGALRCSVSQIGLSRTCPYVSHQSQRGCLSPALDICSCIHPSHQQQSIGQGACLTSMTVSFIYCWQLGYGVMECSALFGSFWHFIPRHKITQYYISKYMGSEQGYHWMGSEQPCSLQGWSAFIFWLT